MRQPTRICNALVYEQTLASLGRADYSRLWVGARVAEVYRVLLAVLAILSLASLVLVGSRHLHWFMPCR